MTPAQQNMLHTLQHQYRLMQQHQAQIRQQRAAVVRPGVQNQFQQNPQQFNHIRQPISAAKNFPTIQIATQVSEYFYYPTLFIISIYSLFLVANLICIVY